MTLFSHSSALVLTNMARDTLPISGTRKESSAAALKKRLRVELLRTVAGSRKSLEFKARLRWVVGVEPNSSNKTKNLEGHEWHSKPLISNKDE